jgi:hypothetical protein
MQSHIKKAHPEERIWRCDCDSETKYVSKVVEMCYQRLVGDDWICSEVPAKIFLEEADQPVQADPTPAKFKVTVKVGGSVDSRRQLEKPPDPDRSMDPVDNDIPDYSWLQDSVESRFIIIVECYVQMYHFVCMSLGSVDSNKGFIPLVWGAEAILSSDEEMTDKEMERGGDEDGEDDGNMWKRNPPRKLHVPKK